VLRNVKYNLAKTSNYKAFCEEKTEKSDKKWDLSKLAVGNWFSEMQYYKLSKMPSKETSYYYDILIHKKETETYNIDQD